MSNILYTISLPALIKSSSPIFNNNSLSGFIFDNFIIGIEQNNLYLNLKLKLEADVITPSEIFLKNKVFNYRKIISFVNNFFGTEHQTKPTQRQLVLAEDKNLIKNLTEG